MEKNVWQVKYCSESHTGWQIIIICQPVWGDHVLIKPNIVFLLVRVYGIF